MKEIIDKLDLITIKIFCSANTLSREWEYKPQTGKKIVALDILDEDPLSNIQKELL